MENHKYFKIMEARYATLLKMDGLYLYTSSVKIFLVNPFSRLQKISKRVPLCTRAPRISKCFHFIIPTWVKIIKANIYTYTCMYY